MNKLIKIIFILSGIFLLILLIKIRFSKKPKQITTTKIPENTEQVPKPRKKTKSKSTKKQILQMFFLCLFILCFIQFVGQRAVIKGSSMEPTLYNNDNVILDKLSIRFGKLDRYDIVVFPGRMKNNRPEMFIKRIVGLPGETVTIKNGKVFIDNIMLHDEKYANGDTFKGKAEYQKVHLGNNEYYCLGDNRQNSDDSRYIGPIHLNRKIKTPDYKEIIGIVRWRLYPIKNRKPLY